MAGSSVDCATWNSWMESSERFQRRGAYGFVGNIDTVHLDTRGTALSSLNGDSCKAVLSRVEVPTILNLNPRAQLSQIQKIPPVEGQHVNLLGSGRILHRGLHGVDLVDIGLDRDLGRRGLWFQAEISINGLSDQNVDRRLGSLKPAGSDREGIVARLEAHNGIGAGLRGGTGLDRARGKDFAVTATPGTTAPVPSVMVPIMLPVAVCAGARSGESRTNRDRRKAPRLESSRRLGFITTVRAKGLAAETLSASTRGLGFGILARHYDS